MKAWKEQQRNRIKLAYMSLHDNALFQRVETADEVPAVSILAETPNAQPVQLTEGTAAFRRSVRMATSGLAC
jgi:hypothetical protein